MAVISSGMECYDCCVTFEWNEDLVSSVVINYCPKHKAAPELYEALKKLRNPSYDPGRGSGAHRIRFWKAYDMATEALAIADGKE